MIRRTLIAAVLLGWLLFALHGAFIVARDQPRPDPACMGLPAAYGTDC